MNKMIKAGEFANKEAQNGRKEAQNGRIEIAVEDRDLYFKAFPKSKKLWTAQQHHEYDEEVIRLRMLGLSCYEIDRRISVVKGYASERWNRLQEISAAPPLQRKVRVAKIGQFNEGQLYYAQDDRRWKNGKYLG